MPKIKTLFSIVAWKYKIKHFIQAYLKKYHINYRGIVFSEPGHFYSPLINIYEIERNNNRLDYDGVDYWAHLNLNFEKQREFFKNIIPIYKSFSFPIKQCPDMHYYSDNIYFPISDAYLLSAIIEINRPKKIVEVGSGFSSAVILDTVQRMSLNPKIQFIEPYPNRLNKLVKSDKLKNMLIKNAVQECPLEIFEELESGDILFIDSSHVAKVGSDVSHTLLKILPRLKNGVLIHFHDIFYPESYPLEWIKNGCAWNESLFLRCFLMNNSNYRVVAFNSYAWNQFPEIFMEAGIDFRSNPGGSIWIDKISNNLDSNV